MFVPDYTIFTFLTCPCVHSVQCSVYCLCTDVLSLSLALAQVSLCVDIVRFGRHFNNNVIRLIVLLNKLVSKLPISTM